MNFIGKAIDLLYNTSLDNKLEKRLQCFIFFSEEGPTGQTVSFVLPVKGQPDVLLIGHGQELSAVKWPADAPDFSSARAVSFASVDAGKKTRFNDGKCDPHGRVWAGILEHTILIIDHHCKCN